MAGTIVEWVAFFLFIFLFIGSVIGEVQWLIRKGWTTSGRAVGFVLTTDLLGFFVGGLVVFVAFLVMFMMVMGPAGRGGTAPEAAYWIVSLAALIFPSLFLVISKRIFLLVFKIGSGKSAWVYSLVSTLLILLVVLIPPPLMLYLVVTIWKL